MYVIRRTLGVIRVQFAREAVLSWCVCVSPGKCSGYCLRIYSGGAVWRVCWLVASGRERSQKTEKKTYMEFAETKK
jgi:hypothetical protein